MDAIAGGLLPPAILPVVALILLLADRRRSAGLLLALLVLLSVEAVPQFLCAGLLLPGRPARDLPLGAIVVLASNSPGLLDPSRTVPGIETLKRLRTAAALHRRTGTPILVSGARDADGPIPVATAMADSLDTDFGVRAAWTETRSTNPWQSAAAIAAMLQAAGITRIYVVAQPWEMRLATSIFRGAGLDVVPAEIPNAQPQRFGFDALVAITPVWLDSAVALRQWVGLACQATPTCVAWMRS